MKILFVGAPVAPHPNPSAMWTEKLEYYGENTGNLLIGQSLREELSITDFHFGHHIDPAEASERFDMIVIPAANFIFKNFDFDYLAKFVEATSLPCMMVGLGAQAPSTGSPMSDIPAGTMRFLALVADRSNVIGVRGEFTAEVMNDFGYKNVEPLGCPSLYRTAKRELKVKRPGTELKLSLNGSSNVIQHSVSAVAAQKVESAVLRLSLEKGYNYVLQNETTEMTVQHDLNMKENDLKPLATLVKRFGLGVGAEEYALHIRTKFKTFFDLGSWDDYIRGFDASIGSRFHGNLIALTNGVPAFLITHDSRTAEMAQLMRIPHRSVDKINELDVQELFASSDYDAFERRYTQLYDRYADFLSKNGLRHKLQKSLATATNE
jgi:hypothetical protein